MYLLAVKGVQGLKPYEPGKPLAELEREYGISNAVKLASNENPLGMSLKAKQAAIDAVNNASLYPDGNAYYLKQALAAHLSGVGSRVDAKQITVGNGSNELLEIIARCFASQDAAIMYSQHAFAVYPLITQAIGASHQMIPAKSWGHDLHAMRRAVTDKTKIIFIANPNNPTGTFLASLELLSFIKSLPKNIIVVIDEAYHEYVDERGYISAMNWVNDFENLIVTRTFSKAYGLAGLRVGYCVAHRAMANLLNRVRQPFNVNVIALAAAEAALEDRLFIGDSVAINNVGKTQLYRAFDDMALNYLPSQGNFIALDLQRAVDEINERLLKRGVIVRPIGAYQMPTYIRVSVGTEQQNNKLVAALRAVLL
ncbi:MAG TPA: histidinol-phosphate transaminase [Gammaproteobacteria bacterium]|nr:histidinol-phosphate transaminase [Gammaproteobacteria bacterium]